jgi:hypothetical protein
MKEKEKEKNESEIIGYFESMKNEKPLHRSP